MQQKQTDNRPWYRHPWPWLLMVVPAASMVVGTTMLILALNSPGDVVVDNYYEEGRGINQSFAMDHAARDLGMSARLELDTNQDVARIHLDGRQESGLQLRVYHAIESGRDRHFFFLPLGPGEYQLESTDLVGMLQGNSRWYLELRDVNDEWRLRRRLQTPAVEMQW